MATDLNNIREAVNHVADRIKDYTIPISLTYSQWQSCKAKVSELGSKIPLVTEARNEIAQIYENTLKLKEIAKKVFNTNGQNGNNFVLDSEIKDNDQAVQQNYDSLLESFKNWELFNNNDEYAEKLADLCGLQMMFYHALKSIISRTNKVISDCKDMICVLDTVKSYYKSLSQSIDSIRKTQMDRFQQSTVFEDYSKSEKKSQDLESLFATWWNQNIYVHPVEQIAPLDAQKKVEMYTG